MTDNKILRIRIGIALIIFVILSGTLIPFIKNLSLRSKGLLVSLLLFLLSFAMLANGVSYLSEIIRKHGNSKKITTGILSLMIFVFVLFPQDQDTSPIIVWTIVIGLSLSSILISVFSLLEFTYEFSIMRIYSFVFSIFSGISSCIILSFIFRGYNHSEAWMVFLIYGFILFLISTIVNLFVLSSYKNGITSNSKSSRDGQ